MDISYEKCYDTAPFNTRSLRGHILLFKDRSSVWEPNVVFQNSKEKFISGKTIRAGYTYIEIKENFATICATDRLGYLDMILSFSKLYFFSFIDLFTLNISNRVELSINCLMDFKNFPHDVQTCSLELIICEFVFLFFH